MKNTILNEMYTKNLSETMELKSMNATEKIAATLKMRGLFVKIDNYTLLFSKANAHHDVRDVMMLFNKLNIPFVANGPQRIEILVNSISTTKMKKLFFAGGHPFPIDYVNYHSNWKSFVSRTYGYRVNAFQLEHNIAHLVKAANLAGLSMYAGCNGHLKESPRFQLTGAIMGTWFKVIQQLFMANKTFNYQWEIVYDGLTGAELRAKRAQAWDQQKIHEDTLKLATLLEKYADEIRTLKKMSFRKCQKAIVNNWIEERNYNELEQWMLIAVKGVQNETGIIIYRGTGEGA